MLLGQHLPKVLWGTAALHAAYLLNHAYTQTLPEKTPFEQWCGIRPNVENLQEFGIPVSILSKATGHDKLDPHGDIHVFLGFEDGPKAIHYYDMKTRQVKNSQNYHFLLNAEHPLYFKGEQLEDDEEFWEPRDKENAPLIICIPKHSNVLLGGTSIKMAKDKII